MPLSVLLLCHGNDDAFDGSCRTAGIPMTLEIMRSLKTVDVRRNAADFSLDFRMKSDELPVGEFDVVTTMCCPYDVFVKDRGRGLVAGAFQNVASSLRPGGRFVFTTAHHGLVSLAKHYRVPLRVNRYGISKKTSEKILSKLGEEIRASGFGLRPDPVNGQAFKKWLGTFLSGNSNEVDPQEMAVFVRV